MGTTIECVGKVVAKLLSDPTMWILQGPLSDSQFIVVTLRFLEFLAVRSLCSEPCALGSDMLRAILTIYTLIMLCCFLYHLFVERRVGCMLRYVAPLCDEHRLGNNFLNIVQ